MIAERKLTGRGVAVIFAAAFGVIISVNLLLAYSAVKTFPGLETKNSYIASQEFDQRRAEQQALGWAVRAWSDGTEIRLSIRDNNGQPVEVSSLEALLGRATHVKDDRSPRFVFDGRDYVAQETLSEGNWNIRMRAESKDGILFQKRIVLRVER